MSSHPVGDVVAVWTSSGHHLTSIDTTPSGTGLDQRDERMIGDVVGDDWVYPARRTNAPTEVSDSAALVRRTGVILL